MKRSTIWDKPFWVRLGAVLFWVAVWQGMSMAVGHELLLASPARVLRVLAQLVTEPGFWASIGFSFFRIIGGFLLAAVLGVLLAALSCRFRLAEELLRPLAAAVKATPVASFIILALIWLDSGSLSVLISFLIVFPVVYTNGMQGIRAADPKLLELMEVFRVGGWRRLAGVYLPASFPSVRSACAVGLGLCWKAGVAAEVIGIPRGSIGERLYEAKLYFNTGELFAWTIVIILVSVLFERAFLALLDRAPRLWERM